MVDDRRCSGAVIGVNVGRYRVKRAWSQGDLATRCGWSRAKVAKLETGGYRHVFVDDLLVLVRVLRVPADRLLEGL